MGGCFSCRPPSSSSVRVVHLNGKVEEFEHPVTVRQVIGKAGKHVVCTPAQLLIIGVKPLQPTTQLEAGRIYLMLPLSTHHVSPHDLASAVKKLTAAAAKTRSPCPGNAREEERVSHVVKRPWKPVLDPIAELSDEPL